MNILYIGDVMGEAGMQQVERLLPKLRREEGVDVVIAQAENVSDGKGMRVTDYRRLKKAGVDGFSGGNHTLARPELFPLLADPDVPVIGPANMPDCPGPGYAYIGRGDKRVLFVSLLGHIVGKDADKPFENPLVTVDEILARENPKKTPVVVNFHGDFSSEKVVVGHYLDGRAALVVGDHWHVPTADTRVLPGGTAHMTDVGMVGVLNSSLGVAYDSIIPRWRDSIQTKNELATEPPYQFNAVLVVVSKDGLAESAKHIQKIVEA